eukprot:TRINITY_DN9524_c0_g1_i1.p1 TRINITY_DN9524_c0_g1~~TRINITY_DN9524_c0_g1_i1.p1  ORF type:complete len:703 (+),score=105.20 TRINITY_DN9524_c0_g1_i1:55-2163(+)
MDLSDLLKALIYAPVQAQLEQIKEQLDFCEKLYLAFSAGERFRGKERDVLDYLLKIIQDDDSIDVLLEAAYKALSKISFVADNYSKLMLDKEVVTICIKTLSSSLNSSNTELLTHILNTLENLLVCGKPSFVDSFLIHTIFNKAFEIIEQHTIKFYLAHCLALLFTYYNLGTSTLSIIRNFWSTYTATGNTGIVCAPREVTGILQSDEQVVTVFGFWILAFIGYDKSRDWSTCVVIFKKVAPDYWNSSVSKVKELVRKAASQLDRIDNSVTKFIAAKFSSTGSSRPFLHEDLKNSKSPPESLKTSSGKNQPPPFNPKHARESVRPPIKKSNNVQSISDKNSETYRNNSPSPSSDTSKQGSSPKASNPSSTDSYPRFNPKYAVEVVSQQDSIRKSIGSVDNKNTPPQTNEDTRRTSSRNIDHLKDYHEAEEKDIELIEKIGEGSYGIVWRGKWAGVTVAIKSVKSAMNFNQKAIEETKKELKVWSHIKCQYTIQLMAASINPQSIYIITELMDCSLYHLLHIKNVVITWGHFKTIITDVLDGLIFLHFKKIIHRDLKTLNILISGKNEFRAKIGDFGLSTLRLSSVSQSKAGSVGTPVYMSPEVIDAQPATEKSDIYSMAIVINEVISKQIPYENLQLNPTQLVIKVFHANLRPSKPSYMPNAMDELVTRSWNADPEKRPTASELKDQFEKVNCWSNLGNKID